MSSLFDRYLELYQQLKDIKEKYDTAQRKIESANEDKTEERELHIERLKGQLSAIDDYLAKVESYRKLAEEHIKSKNILTITPRELNFGRMRDWSSKINPGIEDDPYAQRVYVLAKCNEMYLDQKRTQFERKISELEDQDNHASEEIIAAAKVVQDQLETECQTVVSSKIFLAFVDELKAAHDAYASPNHIQTASNTAQIDTQIGIGGYALPFPVIGNALYHAKSLLQDHFDAETGSILLPVELPASKPTVLSVLCTAGREKRLYRAIQNYLLNIISNAPVGNNRIYILDALHYNNTSLGALRPLTGTVVMEEIPKDSESLTDTLRQIVSEFADIDETIGIADSIEEYNNLAKPKERIPQKTLVLIGYPAAFSSDAQNFIKRILINFERYGVSVVTVNTQYSAKSREEDSNDLPVEIAQGLVRVKMLPQKTLIRFNAEREHHFRWYEFKQQELLSSFLQTIKEQSACANTKGNEYIKRVDLEEITFLSNGRGRKHITLPYGVDNRDQIHSATFDNENFAAYLMGASGSGKSTLLHTLITGILRNYHPDDVELWLADFKMAEFSQYIEPMPPHVKYILLDESRELVFDLIDRLTDKLMERQKFFMQAKNRDYKKVENVPKDVYMPIIFVILDEFSIMSQAIAEYDQYKLKLQNLLAKGRSNGIKFIFSSQTFTKGVAGLTPTAKEQVQMRFAMKNSKDEINSTLEISASERTEQVRGWIDALPPHYALYKHYDGEEKKNKVEKLQVMYFKEDSRGRNAFAPQKRMIEQIKKQMSPVEEYSPAIINCFVDKHPVVVDGNSFQAFSSEACAKEIQELRSNADYNGDELFCFAGTPRLMHAMKEIAITPESRQNVLLIGDSSERSCVASVLSSLMKSFKLQGKDVEIWTYERDRLFRSMRDSDWMAYPIISKMEDICASISALKKSIVEDQVQIEKLIVLLGFENVCADFEFISPDNHNSNLSDEFGKTVAAGMVSSGEEDDEVSALKRQQFESLSNATTSMDSEFEQSVEEGEFLDITDMDAFMAKLTQEYSAQMDGKQNDPNSKTNHVVKLEPNNPDVALSERSAALDVAVEMPKVYDAKQDLKFCVQQGSRKGIHFVLNLTSYGDLKQTGLSLDVFRHRMAFRISKDDSREVFRQSGAESLPEHICLYSDTLEQFSFRPYLHKDISWDGWGIDETGQVISPLDADED